MAWWLSWLERRPVTAEVVGSSPIWVVFLFIWDFSSAGRASALQAEGHRFEPYRPQLNADVAQLAEQLICNQQVIGSSPIIGFIDYKIDIIKYGRIPEWPKGTDCKSAGNAFGGSNPPPPILNLISRGGAVWKLVGLITRRSQVQILPPLRKTIRLFSGLFFTIYIQLLLKNSIYYTGE